MDLNYGNDYSGIVEADRANVWHHLTQQKKFESVDPLIIIEGKGNRVWNQKGREHLDATSGGVWTVNVGYGRAEIADAVRDQLLKMNYFAGAMGTIPGAKFAERLIEKMPGMSRVYYSNSGSGLVRGSGIFGFGNYNSWYSWLWCSNEWLVFFS